MQGKSKARGGKRGKVTVEQMVAGILKRFDENNDKKVSKKEAEGERIERAFRFLDGDKDGFLDQAELKRLASRLVARMGNGGAGGGGVGQRVRQPVDFDALDSDADGRVTRVEAGDSPLGRAFGQIDDNKDGKLSRREYEGYVREQQQGE